MLLSILLLLSLCCLSCGQETSCLKDAKNINSTSHQTIQVDLSTYNYYYTTLENGGTYLGVQYKVSGLCSNFTVYVGDGTNVFCPNKTKNNGAYTSEFNGTASFLVHFSGSKGYYFSLLVDDKNCTNFTFEIHAYARVFCENGLVGPCNNTNSTIPDSSVCNVTSTRNCTSNGGNGSQKCVLDSSKNSTQWGDCMITSCIDKDKTLRNNTCIANNIINGNTSNKLLPSTVGFIIGGVILSVFIVVGAVLFEYAKLNKSRKGYTVVE